MAAGLEAMTDTVGRSEGTGRGATRGEGGATRVSEPIGVEGARGDIAILPGGPPGAAVPKGSGLPRGAKAGSGTGGGIAPSSPAGEAVEPGVSV